MSRRIESDADAVRVLTVHAAEDYSFRAILWQTFGSQPQKQHAKSQPTVFYAEDGKRKIILVLLLIRLQCSTLST